MKHILFDLDGTLVDSSQGILSSFRYTFTELQKPLPGVKELSTFIGPPLETTFAHYFQSEEEIKRAIKAFRFYYHSKGVHQASLYSGIPQLLEDLQQAGYHLYVTTSKNEPMANVMLTELSLKPYFKAIYGALPTRYHKADVIEACLSDNNILKEEAVIIGDTIFDIVGGKKAGIKTLGITWGFGLQEDLQTSQADTICQHPKEIQKALQTL